MSGFLRRYFKNQALRKAQKRLRAQGVRVSSLKDIDPQRTVLVESQVRLNNICILPVDDDDKSFSADMNLRIGRRSYFCSGTVRHLSRVGRYCSIADGVIIGEAQHPTDWLSSHPFQYGGYHSFTGKIPYTSNKKPVQIGNDVWIGSNVIISAGVTIGDGAVIAAGSIVTKDVEPYAIAGGVPAKLLRYRFDKSVISSLLALQWWNYQEELLEGVPFNDIYTAVTELENRIGTGKYRLQQPDFISITA